MSTYTVSTETLNVDDGAQIIDIPPASSASTAWRHQLTIECAAESGAFDVEVLWYGRTSFVALIDRDTGEQASIPLTGVDGRGAIEIQGRIEALRIVPSGVPADTPWRAVLTGVAR